MLAGLGYTLRAMFACAGARVRPETYEFLSTATSWCQYNRQYPARTLDLGLQHITEIQLVAVSTRPRIVYNQGITWCPTPFPSPHREGHRLHPTSKGTTGFTAMSASITLDPANNPDNSVASSPATVATDLFISHTP